MIATSLTTKKTSWVVGTQDLKEINSSTLLDMLSGLTKALHFYGFPVCMIVGDGATENASLFSAMATEPASSYLSDEVKNKFPKVAFDAKIAWKHPITGLPIFILEDMPHVVKRIVNAMESSSRKKIKEEPSVFKKSADQSVDD